MRVRRLPVITPPVAPPLPRPNVFEAGATPGAEDRFTAHWHVLLDWYPEIGQVVVDLMAARAGVPASRFVVAENHPSYTAEDRPDFRLRCADYVVLCEHKLDAPLGPRQLERYCALEAEAGRVGRAYVALVAARPTPVPDAVLAMPHYLRPAGPVPHFRWEDFYPAVRAAAVAAGRGGRLAADFADHMARRGLEPWAWVGWGDLFVEDSPASEQFRRLWRPLVARMRQTTGAYLVPDPIGLGLQWRTPRLARGPTVSLVHVRPVRSLAPPDPRVPGRALSLRVWQPAGVVAAGQTLPAVNSPVAPAVAGRHGPIFARPRPGGPANGGVPGAVFVREYLTGLDGVLAADAEETGARLDAVVMTCMGHLGA